LSSLDGPLPNSREAEAAVLAGVLLEPSLLPVVEGRLEGGDFYFEGHRLIYRALQRVRDSCIHLDLRTLQAELEQRGALERAGGLATLATLDNDLPDLGRVPSYAEIVKERALRRRLMEACAEISRDCRDGGLKAPEAFSKAGEILRRLLGSVGSRRSESIGPILETSLAEIEDRPPGAPVGLSWGFQGLDLLTQGLRPGHLVVVGGRPGMGKTSLAAEVAAKVALDQGGAVVLFSLEMTRQEMAFKVLTARAEVPLRALLQGLMSDAHWQRIFEVAQQLEKVEFFIDDTARPRVAEVVAKARALHASTGLDLVIIDYLQLLKDGGRSGNRNLELTEISGALKELAKELQLPVLVLAQLSRAPERRQDHRPQLGDLRESGAIEQDADLVAFVYRQEVYEPTNPEVKGQAEVIIRKNRHGELGAVHLLFDGPLAKFRDLEEKEGPY